MGGAVLVFTQEFLRIGLPLTLLRKKKVNVVSPEDSNLLKS